ncbi:hypothetical protein [Thioalkalivibrio sp. XN279]|uniref:hypothetical protein n=1 Tax=Thioalkalivibrio sp. XN279 TaxID=2714953 RepID=UPI001409A196|nr:hypothetical protein [Thioalkalivibrio sp. XN279]NHA13993.1 hypothetical protein [Thioalkalivibrio sp. XN279]
MKLKIISATLLFALAATATAEDAGKTLAATLDIYAFPKAGQAAEQQSKDEAACYDWAATNTGVDPFAAEKEQAAAAQEAEQKAKQAQGATQGAGASGAVKGAAAGAVVGELSHADTGESAAVGAAVGLVASRRRARAAGEQAQQQAAAEADQAITASAEEVANFKKAFSACMEAKDYLVRY